MSSDILGNEQFYDCFEDANKKTSNANQSNLMNDITNELENKVKIQNQNIEIDEKKENINANNNNKEEISSCQQQTINDKQEIFQQQQNNDQTQENDILFNEDDVQTDKEEFQQKMQEQEQHQEVEKSLEKALEFKESGNKAYKYSDTNQALMYYEQAEQYCPIEETKTLAIIYSNMAICYKQHKDLESTILYSSKAIELNNEFIKPYMTRVDIYEQQEKFEECLEDYKQLAKLDPQNPHYKLKVAIIGQKVEEIQKKKMDEVVTGLKDIGNKVLGYFGLSTDNFKLQKNENGSYNIQFQQ